MKRALAERAKQSGIPNGVGSTANRPIQEKSAPSSVAGPASNGPLPSASAPASAPNNTSSNSTSSAPKAPVVPKPQTPLSSQVPKKISKVSVKKPVAKTKTSSTMPVRSPRVASSSPRPKKRARESSVKLEDEDEDDSNATSFYLRHQNRALASELRSAKYQLTRLEREREHRRDQCLQAVENLNQVYIRWKNIEVALQNSNPTTTEMDIPESDAPLSTGSGKSVEWVGALMNSLTRIGTTIPSKATGNNGGENAKGEDDTMNVDEEVDAEEQAETLQDQECVNNMMNLAEKMSVRFSLLQSWISTLMQTIDNSNTPLNGQTNNGQSWSSPSTLELQNQVTKVEAENITLQELVKELTRSRDEMVESDRRVRRGLYRLAAGRVKLKEVLKAVANADEDKESAAAWMETTTPGANNAESNQSSSATAPSQDGKTEKGDEKSQVSSKEVEKLKKELADLETLATSRNEQIKKVRSTIIICVDCV